MVAVFAAVLALAAPPPDAPLPQGPAPFARALVTTTQSLNTEIDAWRTAGTTAGAPPQAVTLYALYQQRLLLRLTRDRPLARAVLSRLPATLAGRTRDVVIAKRELARITPRSPLRRLRTGAPLPPGQLRAYYRAAERRFGVAWNVLAAVNFVETAFNRLRNSSATGAQGPMQFMPSTWRRYGLGGDIHDPHDAILAAANYLHASGAPRDYARALHAYNPSWAYVDAVSRYARHMKRDPRAFYAYYSWQVFVRTPSGYRRITGPR